MATVLNPYLSFRDQAREAIGFYQSVFGGEVQISTFGEFNMSDDAVEADKVMHGQLETPSGFTLMAADTPNSMELTPGGTYSISVSGDDEGELRRYWDGLADGATILMPLERAPWGAHFGGLVDKFGVSWFVNIAPAANAE